MATATAQRKWRDKHRFVKRQLNVMAGRRVHRDLDEIAREFSLRGKGEAVTFAAFLTKALKQHAEYNAAARRMIEDFADIYHRDREDFTV